ncbi:MAG: WD40/YVTN/BNR-like repeat-containing protein [Marmoricola sp.]
MPNTTRKPATARAAAGKPTSRAGFTSAGRGGQRPPAPPQRRWRLALGVGGAAVALVAGGLWMSGRGGDSAPDTTAAGVYVGGDLHTLTVADGRLYVGGHDGVAVSTDGGTDWTSVTSLRGADAMGWAITPAGIFAGGHPGLFRSTNDGSTFTKTAGLGTVSDVHALGAAGATAYLASPQAGLLTSDDGGLTWQPRNSEVGHSFMGTILVDPANPQRLIAPDMQNGLVTSSDGGTTWTSLGGPGGAMAAAWDPTNTQRIVAVGMNGGAISSDGGRTWTDLTLPPGTSAATFSTDGKSLYAAALDGNTAHTFASADAGTTWTPR